MIGKVFSHYKIMQKLGEGGMGAVYLAEDTELRRKVALKFLPEDYINKPEIKARFKREAQAAAALNHPNIITIYEVGEAKEHSFIAMEYVEGKSLRELIDAKEIPFEKALKIFLQVCDGLSFAHQHGIIHRDIKPANIMVDKYGRVKVLDFGLAKYKGLTRLTREGTTMGTPHYMSPEQATSQVIDHRSDIYSLGVVLYELLSGKLPFVGDYEAAILYAIVHQKPTPITKYRPDISRKIQQVIDKALEKDVQSRYQRIEDMLADLKIKEYQPTKVYEPTKILEEYKPPKKKTPLVIASLSSGVVLVVVLLLLLNSSFRSGNTDVKKLEQPTVAKASEDNRGEQEKEESQITPPTSELLQQPSESAVTVGSLQVSSVPSGASVWLNGKVVGKTPYSGKKLKTDQYQLRVRLDGYEDFSRSVQVNQDQTTTVNATLTALFGGLHIQSEPPGAEVFLNGQKVGTTPYLNQKTAAVKYDIVLHKEGYRDYATTVTLKPDKIELIEGNLPALIGNFKIRVKPYGSIYIDGVLRQRDTEFQHKEELPVGSHIVRVIHPTFGIWEKSVTIEAAKITELVVDFNQKVRVTIASKPTWGDIYVDNQPTGFQTTKEITLRVGQHTIEVRRDGYETVGGKKILNLEEDSKEPLVFELRKKS
jgi:serine/threonine protein kinase